MTCHASGCDGGFYLGELERIVRDANGQRSLRCHMIRVDAQIVLVEDFRESIEIRLRKIAYRAVPGIRSLIRLILLFNQFIPDQIELALQNLACSFMDRASCALAMEVMHSSLDSRITSPLRFDLTTESKIS